MPALALHPVGNCEHSRGRSACGFHPDCCIADCVSNPFLVFTPVAVSCSSHDRKVASCVCARAGSVAPPAVPAAPVDPLASLIPRVSKPGFTPGEPVDASLPSCDIFDDLMEFGFAVFFPHHDESGESAPTIMSVEEMTHGTRAVLVVAWH